MDIAVGLEELQTIVGPRAVRGTITQPVTGIAALETAEAADLSFLGNPKYKSAVRTSRAGVVLLPADYDGEPAAGQCYLLVDNPSAALAAICARIEQQLWPRPAPGVHPSAVVAPDAVVAASATVGPLCVIEAGAHIGERAHLQAQVFVGREARIGADSWLGPGASVATTCEIGQRVRLHAGVVVGSDGFGYEVVDGRHAKVPQVGNVVIEDDVEIGANTTLDRARFSRTVVGQGTKIDNLVQIAHNVIIGRHCILCAQAGISGSTTLEDYVVLGGQAGIGGHITLARGTKLGGQTGVSSDTEPGVFLTGTPAMPYMLERRIALLSRRLPDLFKQVAALAADIEALKKTSAA